MDEWRNQQQQQQHHHRMGSGGVGPILNYHSVRSRSSPYPSPHSMSELKQAYQYQPNSTVANTNPLSPSALPSTPNPNGNTTPMPTKTDSNDIISSSAEDVSTTTSNPDVYIPNNSNVPYTAAQMEQIQQQRMMANKSTLGPMVGYHPGQQQMMAARSRSMPYPMPPPPTHHQHQHQHPSMYPHSNGAVCQCAQHMHSSNGHYPVHPSQQSMYYHQQQHQQQQHEAWYRYQQQQAAWRQHQIQQQQQQQQHLQPQPVPIERSYNPMLSDPTSTAKSKVSKVKSKKKQGSHPSSNEESLVNYPPVHPSSLNLSVQQQQRGCIPSLSSSSTAYYPSVYPAPNPYVPAQQLPPPSSNPHDHLIYTQTSPTTLSHHQSQTFTSPLSNPSTPHQLHGEYNGTAEFGVPYHHGAPGSVSSLTDALCPSGDIADRQMTPGPPSVGTPRVASHQYSFPHTPSTPQTINNQSNNPHTPLMMPPTPNPLSAPPTPLTRPRSSGEQIQSGQNQFQQYEQNKSMHNVDDLAAYLKDPTNIYLNDDVSSTLFDDIDALADTYLGQQSTSQQQAHVDTNSAEDILLNFLCSEDLTN